MQAQNDISGAAVQSALALRHLYVAWIGFQRRPLSMQSYVGYRLEYLPPADGGGFRKARGYLGQMRRTLRLIAEHDPDVVWFQSPPSFLTHALVALARTRKRKFRIVADCHNGAIDPRLHRGIWAKFPGIIGMLNRCDVVMAHNDEMRAMAVARGVREDKVVTVETRPAPLPVSDAPFNLEHPVVLVPCSFHSDEPIDMLFDAARRLPHVTFKLTGNKKRAIAAGYVDRAPENVDITGFLDAEDYNALLGSAEIVLGLTTVDGVQLSAANEAVGAARPMVLSDTGILRELFGTAARFTPNEAEPLAAALTAALAELPAMATDSRALKESRERRWQGQINQCLIRLVD